MSKNNKDRLFDLFLVVIGFVLGIVGTVFVNYINENKEIENSKNLIASFVYQEIEISQHVSDNLSIAIDTFKDDKVFPNVYEYAHNTSLFVSLTSHFSKQNIEIQQNFANVVKRLKVCEYYRNVYNKVLSEPNSYQFELIKPLVIVYKEHVDKLILDLKNLNQFLDH